MMVENGTFVLEYQDVPCLTLTCFETQSKEIAFIEGVCSNPKVDQFTRPIFTDFIFDHAFKYLKDKGFKRAIIFTDKDRLAERYSAIGMVKTCNNLTSLMRAL